MSLKIPNVIDKIAHDPATDEVVLILCNDDGWTGTDQELMLLQEKLNTYLSFALDGEMSEAYAGFAEKKIRLQFDTPVDLGERANEFIGSVRHQLAFQEIRVVVKMVNGRFCNHDKEHPHHEAGETES